MTANAVNMAGSATSSTPARFDFGVIGLGVTGRSVAAFLSGSGQDFCCVDTREGAAGIDGFRLEFPRTMVMTGRVPAEVYASCAELVVSPGIDLGSSDLEPAVASGRPLIGDIELFARSAAAPIIAITGTNGKSTVTTMVTDILGTAGIAALSGGNLGPPALDLLALQEPDYYVLEVSSFQLELTRSLQPEVATVLNISPDHLDRHRDMSAYAAIKQRVYARAGKSLVNADDPLVAHMTVSGERLSFSSRCPEAADYGVRFKGAAFEILRRGNVFVQVTRSSLAGKHNAENAMIAAAACDQLGVEAQAIAAALSTYQPLPHRSVLVAQIDGVRYVDDSKATNPGAAISSLQGIRTPAGTIVILGGRSKGLPFDRLGEEVAKLAKAAVVIGEAANEIRNEIADRIPCIHAGDMAEAVAAATGIAESGDTVLLAPACASFDMFEDYIARGAAFVAAVETVPNR